MNKRVIKQWVVVAGISLIAAAAMAQPEQWLDYHTSSENRGYRYLDLTTNAPAGVALPKMEGQIYYARWKTPMDPSGGRWLCLERSRKGGLWDRLYFDTTGNGRLDDKTPVVARTRDEYSVTFPTTRVVFKGEDGPVTYHLSLRFMQYDGGSTYLLSSSACWYEGMVAIGDKKRRVQLFDSDVNGTFNDVADNTSDTDRIQVDGDKVGSRFLGRLLELDGQFYRIEIPRDGAFVKVKKAEDLVFGKVRMSETVNEFIAVGVNGHFVRKPEKGEFTLPAGKYQIYGWTINRKDDKGVTWSLVGDESNTSFDVADTKPASLQIGEPVRGVLQASESTGQVSFSLRFRGSMGETVDIQRERSRPSRGPKLILTSLDGSFKYTNTFEYG
jgi:hypothetical protein